MTEIERAYENINALNEYIASMRQKYADEKRHLIAVNESLIKMMAENSWMRSAPPMIMMSEAGYEQIKKAIEQEREACARLVDLAPVFGRRADTAAAIRARKYP